MGDSSTCRSGKMKPGPRSFSLGVLMPLFGAHMSIAGGCHNALLSAQAHACQTVQLFTKSSNQWHAKELTDSDVALFRQTLRKTKLGYPTAHDSYLINL